jgi:hypothetical protein
VPKEGKSSFHTSKLQLPVGESRESPSRQLSGLQIREGGVSEKEVTENTKDYNAKGIILKPRQPRCVLRGGAAETQSDSVGLSHTRWQ